MYKIRLYLYDSDNENNGYRGNEITSNVFQGMENVDDISQELDTTQLTYINTQSSSLEPTTKIIIDIIALENDAETIKQTLHRIVDEDVVTKLILDGAYSTTYKHEVSLIEPSAIAQKRIVDNTSCTYKLKDVSLATQITYDLQQWITKIYTIYPKWTPNTIFATKGDGIESEDRGNYVYLGKFFQWGSSLSILDINDNHADRYYNDITRFQSGGLTQFKIILPDLSLYCGKHNTKRFDYSKVKTLSTHWEVEEYNLDGTSNGIIANGNYISNANLSNLDRPNFISDSNLNSEWLLETIERDASSGTSIPKKFYKKYTDINATGQSMITDMINIQADKKYVIRVIPYEFPDDPNSATLPLCYKYSSTSLVKDIYIKLYPLAGIAYDCFVTSQNYLPTEDLSYVVEFQTYSTHEVYETLTSGQPYNALMLLQKAVMNTSIKEKINGVSSGNLNYSNNGVYSYNNSFYVDESYINLLRNTNVIENFYNQKNLWEVLLEIGYYIHGIPEIKFGANDKFMITFNKLGETQETSNDATPISIMNFKSIDDYICETSSYISNMVQLGGYIDEWTHAKNSDDNFLTYNDTAEIIVSKPIIELIGLQIKANQQINLFDRSGSLVKTIQAGETTMLKGDANYEKNRDATEYIYEYNIYKILPIIYNETPNKGICMYYQLRDNKIVGGNYQLPQENVNIYSDYSFKKLIYCAFTGTYPTLETKPTSNYWTTLNINDFSFRVIYRTQDSIRQTHTRPDIRKYLVNSKWDLYPQLQQINNQQDVVVDSEKFGSNMYGTLIRVGNLNYKYQEWVSDIAKLKQKGQIYRINNEIYYVAKITNTYYSEYIESIVELSKDYNQLSKVIGIPSEPRFYEISEQSVIKREICIDEYLMCGTTYENDLTTIRTMSHLKDLIFGNTQAVEFAKYVMTTFKGDKDIGTFASTYGEPNLNINVLHPINAYSSGTTLTYEWDCVDNFSAGDKIGNVGFTNNYGTYINDKYYSSLETVKYTDKYGKATLMDFYILKNIPTFTESQINNLPLSPYSNIYNDNSANKIFDQEVLATNVYDKTSDNHSRGLVLLKDCREQLSFNYNIHLITDSDTFVISPFCFTPKQNTSGSYVNCKLVLLNDEVNKLSNGYFNTSNVIIINNTSTYNLSLIENKIDDNWGGLTQLTHGIELSLSTMLGGIDNSYFTNHTIKAIAITYDYDSNKSLNKFVIAKNIPTTFSKIDAITDWYFYGIKKEKISDKLQ